MKRFHWWTVMGVAGTGVAATLLSQSVWGQPESRVPPLPPLVAAQPTLPPSRNAEARPDVPSTALPTPPLPAPPIGGVAQPPIPGVPPPPTPAVPDTVPYKAESLPPAAPVAPSPTAEKSLPETASYAVQPGRQQPSLSIEWAGPPSVRINYPMTCQIIVRNTSTVPVQNVIVRHRLGEGVTCKASEPKAAQDAGTLSWSVGNLAPDQTCRLEVVLIAQNHGPMNCNASATFTAVAAHQVQVSEPKLAVTMRSPDKIVAGESVPLVITITNPGDGVADAVKIKIVLPDGIEHGRGKIVDYEVGSLQPKDTKALQLTCLAKGSGPQKCSITVTGEGNLSCGDAISVDVLVPKIDVAMSGPKLRYLDRHAVYVMKVTNAGTAPANQIIVQEAIPAGFKFHQATNDGRYSEAGRLVSWGVGDLSPGQSREMAVDLIPIEPGEHHLVAQAKTARGAKAEAEVHTKVEGLPSLFMEVSHVDDPIEVGAETAYEIRVANSGTKTENNVEIVCTLPEQLEFKGAKCSQALRFRQEGREIVFESLPKLAPKADVIYRVQVRGIAPGDIRFRTRIRADGLKEPVLREESTRIYSDDAPLRSVSHNSLEPAPRVAPTPPVAPTPVPNAVPPLAPVPTPMPNLGSTVPPLPSVPMPGTLPALPGN